MNLDELSNFFGLTAEVVIGILAFQGIATTFIFSKKENGLMQMFGNLFG